MMDAVFMDLVWWILCPLAAIFALWALVDCIRSPLAVSQFGYVAWMWKVFSFTDEELIDEVGLGELMGRKGC